MERRKKRGGTLNLIIIIMYIIIGGLGVLGLLEKFTDLTVLSNILAGMAYDGNIVAGRCLAITMGMMFLSFLPSIFYFVAFNQENGLRKKGRVVSFIFGLVLCVVGCVATLYFYDHLGYKKMIDLIDGSAGEQVFTLIVSHVGLLIMYLFTLVEIDGNKIGAKANDKAQYKEVDASKSGIMAFFTNVFKFIGKISMKILYFFVKLKEMPILYFSIVTLLFTILCYFTAAIALAIIIVLVINSIAMFFTGVIVLCYQPSPKYSYKIIDGGYERILSPIDGEIGRYKDDTGNYWISEDNGRTFYRER